MKTSNILGIWYIINYYNNSIYLYYLLLSLGNFLPFSQYNDLSYNGLIRLVEGINEQQLKINQNINEKLLYIVKYNYIIF